MKACGSFKGKNICQTQAKFRVKMTIISLLRAIEKGGRERFSALKKVEKAEVFEM